MILDVKMRKSIRDHDGSVECSEDQFPVKKKNIRVRDHDGGLELSEDQYPVKNSV